MASPRTIVDELARAAAAGEAVVLATVVRVVGSSYGGVGARMLVRVDGSTVGLVSGGCLESDLAAHARRVHTAGAAAVVAYDTRADDDGVWGLGLGCNGLIEVLLEPLAPPAAAALAALLGAALAADAPGVLATVVDAAPDSSGSDPSGGDPSSVPAVGAHALLAADAAAVRTTGRWGDGRALAALAAHAGDALAAGRRGLVRDCGPARVAFEVVAPPVRLVVCGSGPDAVPVARLAVQLGWDVTVVDHRPAAHARPERFAGARVVECADARRLADAVALAPRTAVVVMSHHFGRDGDYVEAALGAGVAYVGALGPRVRTERILAELAARGAPTAAGDRLYGPVGLDLGGDGPDAIALAIVAEVAAVAAGRAGGHLRDRRAPIYAPPAAPHDAPAPAPPAAPPRVAAVVLAAGASARLGYPKQLVAYDGEPLVRRAARAAADAGAHPVVVVVGAHADAVAPAVRGLAGVAAVVHDGWRAGLASSLAAGLRAVATDAPGADGVLVTLADQPLVDAAALRRLLDAFAAGHRVVAAAHGDVVGVPAVFGREHLASLAALTGDRGAGAWLGARPAGEVARVPLGAAALDVDTAADVARLASLA